jgi:hypothetical protein
VVNNNNVCREKIIEKVIYSPEVKYIELSINDKKHNAIIQETSISSCNR